MSYKTTSIRVKGEEIPRRQLGMMGDMTRHIEVATTERGETLYRVEDILDAAGENFETPIKIKEPVVQLKKGSIFHYTTRAGADAILAKVGTKQARAVQQLMD